VHYSSTAISFFFATSGIIVFCIGFGVVISQMGDKARVMVDFFVILDAIIMQLVSVIMW
jgi:solute carrier family 1 (high affinity glutamate transporter) protein 2